MQVLINMTCKFIEGWINTSPSPSPTSSYALQICHNSSALVCSLPPHRPFQSILFFLANGLPSNIKAATFAVCTCTISSAHHKGGHTLHRIQYPLHTHQDYVRAAAQTLLIKSTDKLMPVASGQLWCWQWQTNGRLVL